MIILLVLILGTSCTTQNVVHKPVEKIEAIPEEPKSDIKDGKRVHLLFQVYSGLLICVMISIIIKSPKQ